MIAGRAVPTKNFAGLAGNFGPVDISSILLYIVQVLLVTRAVATIGLGAIAPYQSVVLP